MNDKLDGEVTDHIGAAGRSSDDSPSETWVRSRGGARPRILIVDDDPFARTILGDALAAKGFAISHAQSGRDAMRAIVDGRDSPHLVITDLVMPDTDGRTLLALLRVAPQTARVRVIVVTSQEGLERELEVEGAEAVLDKWLGPNIIAEVVAALLSMVCVIDIPRHDPPRRDPPSVATKKEECTSSCLHAAYCEQLMPGGDVLTGGAFDAAGSADTINPKLLAISALAKSDARRGHPMRPKHSFCRFHAEAGCMNEARID